MKKIIIVVALLTFVVVACNKPNNETSKRKDDAIKIGYFGPLSGFMAQVGESVVKSLELANKESNLIHDRKVKIICEDDACDPTKALTAAQKLIEVDQVDILISGVCSSATLAVAPLAERRRKVLISPVAASPNITQAGDYVFRLAASSMVAAQTTAEALQRFDVKKIAILYEDNEYPVGWFKIFVGKMQELSEDVEIASEKIGLGEIDIRTQLTKLNQTRPDLLMFIFINPLNASNALKNYKDLGMMVPVLGNETFSLKSVRSNPLFEGIMVAVYDYEVGSLRLSIFLENYKNQHGEELGEIIYGALAYDTYNVLHQAMSKCENITSDCIKDQLYMIKSFPGLSGNITIDENGDTERRFVIKKIQDGELVDLE